MSYRVLPYLLFCTVAALAISSCSVRHVNRIDAAALQKPPTDKIVGITTTKGDEVSFDGAATINDKTLRATVGKSAYEVPLDQIQRYWIERHDISTGRTVALVGVLGVGTAIAIAVATHDSKPAPTNNGGCPFVYTWDGHQYVFDAELYGGAVARGLQREDYSELPHLVAHDGSYRILVNDELPETDYTDRLELLAVDHRAGTSVGIDDAGKLYSLNAPQVPLSARDENGADLLPWLSAVDRRIWETPPASAPGARLRHEIHLTFSKPADATTAKLLVHAGTGEWGLRMLNTLFELYGEDLESKLASLDANPLDAQVLKLWSANEDLYALKVWVEEPTGWQVRGTIPGGGMGARVVQLDVSRVKGGQVHVRLEPPAGFWAINATAIDYSQEQDLHVNRIAPQSARTSTGKDVLPELQLTDSRYYKAEHGDSASIGFSAAPVRPGMSRTFFLHSNGYYRPEVRSQGPADTNTLTKIFGTRDGLARFAAERYAAGLVASSAIQ